MANLPVKRWMCSWCGARMSSQVRPAPGNCPRKPKTRDGKSKPHTWVRG